MRHYWVNPLAIFFFAFLFFLTSSFAGSPIITCPGPTACILGSYLGLQFPDGTLQSTAATSGTSYTFTSPLVNTGGTVSLLQSSSSQNGYLSSSDWSLFNGKQNALTFGSFSTSTSGVTILNGSSSTVGPNVTLDIQSASSFQAGLLSSTDWNTFNNKQSSLTPGSISTSTTGLSIVNGSSSTVGPNVTLNLQTATGAQPGLLSAADWTTFNSKQSSLSFGNLTESTSSVLTISGGTGSVIGSGTSLQVKQSSSLQGGYLSSSDWSTFNSKQDALTFSSPLVNTTSTISIPSASSSVNGYLSSTDWSTFNNKQSLITAGSTAQYYRGDKTFQTLDTLAVPENTNLYFTNARAVSAVTASQSGQEFYVTKDNGNDSNSGTILAPFKTIGAGITACNAIAAYYKQCIVHVAPAFGGTGSGYVETVTFSQQGVNLICDAAERQTRACLISGQVIVNLTGVSGGVNFNAASNQVYMAGFVVSATTTTNALLFSGSVFQQFISDNNYFDQNGSVSSAVISNSGTSGTGSTVYSYDTVYSNSNATNPAVSISSGARFWMYGSNSLVANGNASGPSVTQSGAGSSAIFNLVQLSGQYNLSDNTATASFNLSTISAGSNPCIVTPSSPNTGYALLAYFGCTSTNTNSITGTGVVVNAPGNIRLSSSGDIISTVTQTSFPGLPQGATLIGNKAPSATNVLLSVFDGHVKVSQTTAPTATVNANAGTSATCTLTNGRDSSGIINLTEGSASWASGTQCTITFNKAYSVAPNCVAWPHNAAAASHLVTQQVFTTTSTTTLLLAFGVADSAATASQWSYKCEEP